MADKSFTEILVFFVGATPQIVTESIYALSQQDPPVYAHEVYIITTSHGKRRVEETLVKQGILARLCTEYDLPPIELTDGSFLVIRDSNGDELDDIRTVEANEAAGDQIAIFLQEKSADPYCRLHCSLAGGRKSMSYYMGISFQLFARQWDKLYHVLVSADFELNDHFYYKPKKNQQIEARYRDGRVKRLNTDDAEISLVELPLILLRNKLPVGGNGVREMVAEGQRNIDSATVQQPLVIDLSERTLYIGKTPIELLPTQLMIYVYFLRLKQGDCRHATRSYCHECKTCFVPLVEMTERAVIEEMAGDYEKMYPGNPFKREELLEKWKDGLDTGHLRQQISKINRAMKEQLNDATLLPFYRVDTVKKYAKSRYGVRVEKTKIAIE